MRHGAKLHNFLELQHVFRKNFLKKLFAWEKVPTIVHTDEEIFENMYKTVKCNNRNEALTALRKMVGRKKAWIERPEQEFAMLRQQMT